MEIHLGRCESGSKASKSTLRGNFFADRYSHSSFGRGMHLENCTQKINIEPFTRQCRSWKKADQNTRTIGRSQDPSPPRRDLGPEVSALLRNRAGDGGTLHFSLRIDNDASIVLKVKENTVLPPPRSPLTNNDRGHD